MDPRLICEKAGMSRVELRAVCAYATGILAGQHEIASGSAEHRTGHYYSDQRLCYTIPNNATGFIFSVYGALAYAARHIINRQGVFFGDAFQLSNYQIAELICEVCGTSLDVDALLQMALAD